MLQAANAWWNSRSAPVRVKPALTEFMSDERTLFEEPAMRPSKKPKTFHSRVSAIGHSKVRNFLVWEIMVLNYSRV
jgi:hypothetical protein